MTPLAFDVPGDPAQSAILYQAAGRPGRRTLCVLAHGAGAGQSHPFMVRYAHGLAGRGLDVVTFNFPYMEAGRRSPDRAPVLEAAFRRVVVAAAAHRHVEVGRLVIGGKSMGGRMATHLAAAPEAWPADAPPLDAVVVFGYPLNPPGGSKVSPDRVSHLLRMTAPTLIVQGTRDSFGGPDDIRRALAAAGGNPAIAIHEVPDGDHSLAVKKTAGRSAGDVEGEVLDAVVTFVAGAIV